MDADQTDPLQAWIDTLTEHGYSITRPRLGVIELLVQSQQALTAEVLFDLALQQDARTSRATVYRTLDLLEELHLVRRVSTSDRQHAYLRADLTMQPLAICEQCGDLQVMPSHLFEQLLAELYRTSNFDVRGHSLHLSGLCRTCRS